MNKRGISPVIATLILISIAVILALIIFLWARSYISDQTIKLDKPINQVCDDIQFTAETILNGNTLTVTLTNQANIPLYGVEVRKKSFTSVEPLDQGVKTFEGSLREGSDTTFDIDLTSDELKSGDNILVVPIIVGESNDNKKSYTCDDGESAQV
jgi:flagellin-like protein